MRCNTMLENERQTLLKSELYLGQLLFEAFINCRRTQFRPRYIGTFLGSSIVHRHRTADLTVF